jgi:uroporphyrinogen-III decarboxylase
VHALGAPVIVHICGDIKPVRHLIPSINSDAISTDAIVNLKALKEDYPQLVTMGNLSTFLLQWGPGDKIRRRTRELVAQHIDIISPACGLSTSTSIEHIRALTETVKESANA